MYLIDKNKVSSILQLAIGLAPHEFDYYINEAEQFDLRQQLNNDSLFLKLKSENSADRIQKLLKNHQYNDKDGNLKFHNGINTALSYFAYSRFVYKSNIRSTSFGFVNKTNPQSEPISKDEKKNMYYHYKNLGRSVMGDVLNFIMANGDIYPEMNCQSPKENRGFKTYVVK
mgnify:CR=1 FL=1